MHFIKIKRTNLFLVALASQVQVSDRPMTQQGLGGMKTAQRGKKSELSSLCSVKKPKINRCFIYKRNMNREGIRWWLQA